MASKQDPQNIKDILDALAQRSKSFQSLWNRMRKYSWDIGGILLIAFAFMTLIGTVFPGLIRGSALLKWVNVIRLGLGWGSIFVVLSAVVLGIWMLKKQAGEPYSVIWVRIFSLEGAVFSLIALFTVIGGHSLERARAGLDGGLVGWGLVEAVSSLIGLFLTGVLAFLGAIIGGVIGLGFSDRVRQQIFLTQDLPFNNDADLADFVADTAAVEETRDDKQISAKRKEKIPPEFRKQFKVESREEKTLKTPPRDEDLPSLELLITGKTFKPNQRHINTSAGLIEKTLAEFGIPAQVVGFQVGPGVDLPDLLGFLFSSLGFLYLGHFFGCLLGLLGRLVFQGVVRLRCTRLLRLCFTDRFPERYYLLLGFLG